VGVALKGILQCSVEIEDSYVIHRGITLRQYLNGKREFFSGFSVLLKNAINR